MTVEIAACGFVALIVAGFVYNLLRAMHFDRLAARPAPMTTMDEIALAEEARKQKYLQ